MNNYNSLSVLLGFVALLLSLNACEVVNPAEGIPAFLKVDAVNTQGTGTQVVSDVWVYVDNQAIGAFNLPADIPILMTGEQSIELGMGIIENGVTAFRSEYPYFNRFETTETLVPGEVITLSPTTNYRSLSEIEIFVKDWDFNSDLNLNLSNGGTIPAINSPSEAIDGKFGLVSMGVGDSTLVLSTSLPHFAIGDPSGREFMELHYKSELDFGVGVVGYDANGVWKGNNFFLGLKARDSWRKIYVNLESQIQLLKNSDATHYEIVFRASKPNGDPEVKIYLDNVKRLRLKS